jgi:uncharacterized membrane protein
MTLEDAWKSILVFFGITVAAFWCGYRMGRYFLRIEMAKETLDNNQQEQERLTDKLSEDFNGTLK